VPCDEKKEVQTVKPLTAENANETVVAPVVGLAESAFGGNLESGGRLCVDSFGRNVTSVAVRIFFRI
jgi:hypothetical protein